MKKAFLVLVVALILVATFFRGEEEVEKIIPKTADVRQVNLYHYLSGALRGGMGEMIETVNRRQREYRVTAEALDHEAFKSMIPTMLNQRMPPDLFTYWAGAKTRELVDQGLLEPIDDIWQEAIIGKRFPQSIVDSAVSYGGHRYLLPIAQHAVVFFYNRRVFERANLSPPQSWQQLVEVAERLKTAGTTPFALGVKERWPAQFWFDYLLLRTAGPQFRRELMEGDQHYTASEVQTAYRMWADLLQRGYFNDTAGAMDWVEAAQLVCKGEAAATLMGTWAIPYLTGKECGLAEEKDFDFFVFPEIDAAVPDVMVGPIDGIVLSRDSANQDFAKKVLVFFSEAEPQKIMSVGSGAFAPSLEINREVYSSLRRRVLAEVEQVHHWAFNYDLATTSVRAEKGLDSFAELIEFPGRYQSILENLETESNRLEQQAGTAE